MEKGNLLTGTVLVAVAFLAFAGSAFAGETPPPTVSVPFPGTLVLLSSGVAGLAWWLGRKR